MSAGRPPRTSPGVIDASQAYTLREFSRRTGMADFALRQAREDGLRTISIGRKIYVRGADFLAFLDRAAEQQET